MKKGRACGILIKRAGQENDLLKMLSYDVLKEKYDNLKF